MNRFRILRYTAYVIEIILAFIIQATPYCLPEVFGGKAILLLPLAISISIFEDDIPAIVFGLICGLLADLSYVGAIGFFSIFSVIVCYISSRLMADYIKTNIITVMLIALVSIPAIILLHFLFYYIFMGYTNIWGFFVGHYLSRIIYTLVFMPVFYGLNRAVSTRFRSAP